MVDAYLFIQEREDDMLNQRISWQTAHLMNATGNFKKKIQPTDLYKPLDYEEDSDKQDIVKRFNSAEEKEQYLKDLMAKFKK